MVLACGLLALLSGCQLADRLNAGTGPHASVTRTALPYSSSSAAGTPAPLAPTPAAAKELSAAIEKYHAGQPTAALAILSLARQLDPGPGTAIPVLELTARIRFDEADQELGVAALQELALAASHDAELLNRCGTQLMRAGATAEALPPLRQAVELAPRQPGYARDLAAALVQSGESAMALDVLEAAAVHTPGSAELNAAMGLISEQLHRWSDAASCYRRSVAGGLNSDSWQRRLAESLYHAEQYAEAARVYGRLLGEDSRQGSVEERARFADAAIRTRQFQIALQILDNLTAELPHRSTDLESLRATCAWELGHRSQAEGIVVAALRHWPDDEQLTALHQFFRSEPGSSDRPPELQQPSLSDLPLIAARMGTTGRKVARTEKTAAEATGMEPASRQQPGNVQPEKSPAPEQAERAIAATPVVTPGVEAAIPAHPETVAPVSAPGNDTGQGPSIELSSWKSVGRAPAETDTYRSAAEPPGPSENWKPRPRWEPAARANRKTEPTDTPDESPWKAPRSAAAAGR